MFNIFGVEELRETWQQAASFHTSQAEIAFYILYLDHSLLGRPVVTSETFVFHFLVNDKLRSVTF